MSDVHLEAQFLLIFETYLSTRAGIPREAATTLEDTLAKVHKSAAWREYLAKNMYEDLYMNADEFGKWLAAQHVEILQFLTDIGLVHKK